MDNFNLQDYIASGKLHATSETLTEAKKQGYDDREDESLGARRGAEKGKKQSMKARRDDSYGKFGKRDAEKKGKNKINKEGLEEVDVNKILSRGGYDEVDDEELLATVKRRLKGKNNINAKALNLLIMKIEDEEGGNIDFMSENARTDAEEEGYEDGFKDAKADMKDALTKMKVSELKAKIRENILSQLNEADEEDMDHQDALDKASATGSTEFMKEDEEVDVDIDVEDEVEVDAEADDIEIERKGVKAKVEVGLSPEEEIVQDSLKAAMDAAQALGSDKLADQIGNTITFFTRQFVVGDSTD